MNDVAYVQLARLLEVGRLHEAAQVLGQALADNPDDPDLHVYAANIAEGQCDVDGARVQLARALSLDPMHSRARAALFDLEYAADNYPEAEELITGLIRDEPANASLLALYARLMLVTFHLEKSRALVDEALRRDPDDDVARTVDVLLSIVEGRFDRASVQMEVLVADDPDSLDVAHTLLLWLVEEGRHREALELARQLLRAEPDDPDLIDSIVELRALTHPLAWPLWPTTRFGWAGSAGTWVIVLVALGMLHQVEPVLTGFLSGLYLAWVAYTWAYGPLMKRWLRRRGA